MVQPDPEDNTQLLGNFLWQTSVRSKTETKLR